MVGAHGSVVGWSAVLWAGRSRVWFRVRSLDFIGWPNPFSRTMTPWGQLSILTEMSTMNLPRVKGGRCVRLAASPPCMSRKCGRLDVSQPSGPPQLIKRIGSSSSFSMYVNHSHRCTSIAVQFLDPFQILIPYFFFVCVCYRSVVLFLNLNVIHSLKF
jgi:hypothetical protein